MAQIRVKTRHHKSLVSDDVATALYNHLRDTIEWEEGVRSKNGFTRLAKTLGANEDKLVNDCIKEVIEKLQICVQLLGIYLNYYKDGSHYTPNHSHKVRNRLLFH